MKCECGVETTLISKPLCGLCASMAQVSVVQSNYYVNTETFHAALAELIAQFQRHNPGMGSYETTLKDGSFFKLKLPKKK